ncbi:hypothetical protein F4604DRAFT_1683335 [Suillus subluteus]|nr:hypothetical protein F4604DRAFT_2045837 [Suillus subluteus]KAG1864321.1 hypothetical protein F4604DRAFT_1683335 [Suillus subluteus]
MHFSFKFLVVVTTLAACMSVTAAGCKPSLKSQLCSSEIFNIQPCCSPLAPRNINSAAVRKSASKTAYRWAGSPSMSTSGHSLLTWSMWLFLKAVIFPASWAIEAPF